MLREWMARGQSRPQAVLCLCALLLAVQVGPWWYSSIDSAGYLSLARSLARGGEPTNLGSRLWWYSPGYPALISPLFLLSKRPFLAISLCQWLLAVGLMLGVYRWARGVVGEWAVWFAALAIVNHGFCIHFRRPLSETAFMCFLVWTINALHGLARGSTAARFGRRLSGCAVLLAALCAIRPVGIMLVPAFAAWAWSAARGLTVSWRRAAIASLVVGIAASAPVAAFVAHERSLAAELGGRSYADEFHDAARSPLESYSRGAQLCVSDIGRVCIPGFFKSHGIPGDWSDPNMLIHLPFFALVCFGWLRWRRHGNDLYQWYVPFYVLLIAAHAMDTGARLLLPLLPALLMCVWFGLPPTGARRQAVIGVALAVQLVVAVSYWLAVDLPRVRRYDQQWPAIDDLARDLADEKSPRLGADVPHELKLMLELALDRPVAQRR